MNDEVLFDDAENSEQSSSSIEVVIEQIPTDQGNVKYTPQIDGQGIYDFEIDNMEEKPWDKPGADITDYFNYGFNEHTWKKYCAAQREFVKGSSNTRGKKGQEDKTPKRGDDRHGRRKERKNDDDRYGGRNERNVSEREGRYDDGRSRRDTYDRSRNKREYDRDKRYDRRK